MEQQGRASVRTHQVECEEARPLHQDRQAHCRGHGEQGAFERGTHQVEEIIKEIIKEIVEEVFEEELVLEQAVEEVAFPEVVEEVLEEILQEALRTYAAWCRCSAAAPLDVIPSHAATPKHRVLNSGES